MIDTTCTERFRQLLQTNLSQFQCKRLDGTALKKAAVALTVVDYRCEGNLNGLLDYPEKSASLILTRRAGGLSSHAGQWALPGGKSDGGEKPAETALRELEEEVGLHLQPSSVLGTLDDFITRSGYHITPVVVWCGECKYLHPNEEVSSIHRIPVAEFMRKDAPLFERGREIERPILYMPVGNTFIATPTAAILYQFIEVVVRENHTRVAHFDQPSFAWR